VIAQPIPQPEVEETECKSRLAQHRTTRVFQLWDVGENVEAFRGARENVGDQPPTQRRVKRQRVPAALLVPVREGPDRRPARIPVALRQLRADPLAGPGIAPQTIQRRVDPADVAPRH